MNYLDKLKRYELTNSGAAPEDGRPSKLHKSITLDQGILVEVPDPVAEKLLRQAGGEIKACTPDDLTDVIQEPLPCSICQQARFWCPTCPEPGQWVCGCDHPIAAKDLASEPAHPLTAHPGEPITWNSPLFGALTGVFLGRVGRRQIRVHHPLTGQAAVIPMAWLVGMND